MRSRIRSARRSTVLGSTLLSILLLIGYLGPGGALEPAAAQTMSNGQRAMLADDKPCKEADPTGVFLFPTSGYMGQDFAVHVADGRPGGIDIWTYEPAPGCGSCKDTEVGCAQAPGSDVRAVFKGTVVALYHSGHDTGWEAYDLEKPENEPISVVALKHTDVPGVSGDVYTIYSHMADETTEKTYVSEDVIKGFEASLQEGGKPYEVEQGTVLGRQGNWKYGDNDLITHLDFEVSCDKTIGTRTLVDPVKWLDISVKSCEATYRGLGTEGDALAVADGSDWLLAEPGEELEFSVELTNTGKTTWLAAEGYHFLNKDKTPWGVQVRADLTGLVAPGQRVRFEWSGFAPSTPGLQVTRWSMQHGDLAFGLPIVITAVVVPAEWTEFRTQAQEIIYKAKELGESPEVVREQLLALFEEWLSKQADEAAEKAKTGIMDLVRRLLEERCCGGATAIILVPALLALRRRRG